jgi:hypothetical protein
MQYIAIVSEGAVAGTLAPEAEAAEFGLLMSGLSHLGEEGGIA